MKDQEVLDLEYERDQLRLAVEMFLAHYAVLSPLVSPRLSQGLVSATEAVRTRIALCHKEIESRGGVVPPPLRTAEQFMLDGHMATVAGHA